MKFDFSSLRKLLPVKHIVVWMLLLGLVFIILYNLWERVFGNKEGFTEGLNSMKSIILKKDKPIEKLVISGGDDWLHMKRLTIYDKNDKVIPYKSSEEWTSGSKGTVTNVKGNLKNRLETKLKYLYTIDGTKYFHSNDINDTLTITFNTPQTIGRIFIAGFGWDSN